MASLEAAKSAKPHAIKTFATRAHPEVTGVGITRTNGGWGLKVNLARPSRKKFPEEVDGVPVVVEVVGEVAAQ